MSSANPKRNEGSGRGLDALPGMMRQAGTRYEVRGHSQKIVPGLEASSYRLQRVARTRNEVRVRLAHPDMATALFMVSGCPEGT